MQLRVHETGPLTLKTTSSADYPGNCGSREVKRAASPCLSSLTINRRNLKEQEMHAIIKKAPHQYIPHHRRPQPDGSILRTRQRELIRAIDIHSIDRPGMPYELHALAAACAA